MENQTPTPKLFYYLGGRKMTYVLLTLFVAGMTEMHSQNGISENFVYLLLGLAALMVTGNVATTIMAIKGTAAPAETTPQEPMVHPDVIAAIQTLKQESDQNKADVSKAVDLIENVKKMVIASVKAK